MQKDIKKHKILEIEKYNERAQKGQRMALWESFVVVAAGVLLWASDRLTNSEKPFLTEDMGTAINFISFSAGFAYLVDCIRNIIESKKYNNKANLLSEKIRLDRIRIDKDKRKILK